MTTQTETTMKTAMLMEMDYMVVRYVTTLCGTGKPKFEIVEQNLPTEAHARQVLDVTKFKRQGDDMDRGHKFEKISYHVVRNWSNLGAELSAEIHTLDPAFNKMA